MENTVDMLGVVLIGAALGVPLLYGISTLLGMKHRQFRPVLRWKQPDGSTAPVFQDRKEPSDDGRHRTTNEGGHSWSPPDT